MQTFSLVVLSVADHLDVKLEVIFIKFTIRRNKKKKNRSVIILDFVGLLLEKLLPIKTFVEITSSHPAVFLNRAF